MLVSECIHPFLHIGPHTRREGRETGRCASVLHATAIARVALVGLTLLSPPLFLSFFFLPLGAISSGAHAHTTARRITCESTWEFPGNVDSIKRESRGDYDYSIVDVALIAKPHLERDFTRIPSDDTLERPIHLHRRGADVESALYSPRNMDHMVSSPSLPPSFPPSFPPSLPPSLPLPPLSPSPSAPSLTYLAFPFPFSLFPLSLPSPLSLLFFFYARKPPACLH
jgi:hypothetical protein